MSKKTKKRKQYGEGVSVEGFSGTKVICGKREKTKNALKRLDGVMRLLGYVWEKK